MGKGRPKKPIDGDHVRSLLVANVSKTKISRIVGVSRPTLDAFISELNMDHLTRRSGLSDNEIDAICMKAKAELPSFGEKMTVGYFRAAGIKLSRAKVRASIHRVDPEGVAARREQAQRTIRRRVYSSPYPHYMWHIDGNHKLVRWGLVIHIGIDGFSRTCVYMRCSDNNRAVTVLENFEEAIEEFNVAPTRIRSDHGGENVLVWQAMIENRTEDNPNPVIAGSSVHNQRVERFNREVNRHVRDKYASIFYELEHAGELDVDNSVDMFCLHYVYLVRINKTLAILKLSHNQHSISTEGNQTPAQLVSSYWHLRDEPTNHPTASGQLVNHDIQNIAVNAVNITSVNCPLNEDDYAVLCQEINPLDEGDGKPQYLASRFFVQFCSSR